jgi:hypothetical protein
MTNEFKRMQQIAGLLTEVNIAPAGNAPKLYVNSVDDGVYKITGVNRLTSPDIILKICTSISNEAYNDADLGDPDFDIMEEEIKPAAKALAKEANKIDPTNSTPLYAGTDGNISFHTLSNMLRYSPDIEQGDWLPQNI